MVDQEKEILKKLGFQNRSDFEKHIQKTIAHLEFIALRIFRVFEDKVKNWGQDLSKAEKNRFVAEAIAPPQKLIKGSDRIAQKIIDSWKNHCRWNVTPRDIRGKEPEKHDPRNFLNTMTDVIRFRIVCNFMNDIGYIRNKIDQFIKNTEKFEKISFRDHIETPFPERRAGHRAFQYVLKHYDADPPVLFEIQIMSQLQHAWDKKDHHLIYEYVRIRKDEKIPVHLKNRMAAMSELLYVADVTFDSLKEEIDKIMEKKKK